MSSPSAGFYFLPSIWRSSSFAPGHRATLWHTSIDSVQRDYNISHIEIRNCPAFRTPINESTFAKDVISHHFIFGLITKKWRDFAIVDFFHRSRLMACTAYTLLYVPLFRIQIDLSIRAKNRYIRKRRYIIKYYTLTEKNDLIISTRHIWLSKF